MKSTVLSLTRALLGSAALLGCAAPGPQLPEVRPVFDVRHAMAPAEAYHQLGRYYQGQGQWARAEDAYRKAIALRANCWEAHNGLGAVLALQGRHEAARAAFEAALAIAPEVDYLHANLRHLERLMGGEPPVATLTAELQAMPPTGEPVPADPGGMPEPAAVVVIAGPATSPAPDVVHAGRPVAATEPGVYVVPETVSATAPAPPQQPPAAPPGTATAMPAVFRLEVTNGNGVTGMARYVGRLLAAEGLPRARLSNQKPFIEPHTRIEYRAGFEAQAEALSERLPGRPGTVAATALRPVTDVRLLLGHDLPRTLDFALQARPVDVASAEALPDY